MAEKLRGVKNPAKGLNGIENKGFKPWYSISPDGEYVEYLTITKSEFTGIPGITPRQIGHRFHYTNEHKIARTLP